MTSQEILAAMKEKCPIRADGYIYDFIQEYVLTLDDKGQQRRSVGLYNRKSNSLVRVLIDKVEKIPVE